MSYAEFMKKGLEENRYLHFKKLGYEDSDIEEIINEWGLENVNKGYDVINFDGTGMLQIEAIGDVDAFESDDDAVEAAIVDGIKIIPVYELPDNFDRKYLGWIDTVENRESIKKYCMNRKNYYCNGNSLK
ncbi:hypothetical protein [Faecalibacillus intestinalis]|jgi:hypothetical protein|uniref:hypothetical protein n=1 Tax=Faecalibacillus intestinalis TaxID=1982626 RepID=UPI002067687D|nr:MAG TPA: hypothetical protein [Caudoviricetes sp.]